MKAAVEWEWWSHSSVCSRQNFVKPIPNEIASDEYQSFFFIDNYLHFHKIVLYVSLCSFALILATHSKVMF